MSYRRPSALLALALAVAAPAFAAEMTPVGTWTTIDDATGKPKSIVQITESNGKLEGKVLEVLQSEQGAHPICKECDGERKDKPVEGMVIIWGVSKDGDVWAAIRRIGPALNQEHCLNLRAGMVIVQPGYHRVRPTRGSWTRRRRRVRPRQPEPQWQR
jgi:hypothetical protein